MNLHIGGYIPTSFLDYPGCASAVVFFAGCQLRCPFCHNPELVLPSAASEDIDAEEIIADLERRAPFLDGVCVTGGEPALQRDLPVFLRKIRSLGLRIKVDTNGARPDVLEQLLAEKLADYAAMDLKASAAEYPRACGRNGDVSILPLVRKSISLLLRSSVVFEFRTTLVPGLHVLEDAPLLGRMAEGAPLFVLQNFRPGNTLDPDFSSLTPFSAEFLEAFRAAILPYVREVKIRA